MITGFIFSNCVQALDNFRVEQGRLASLLVQPLATMDAVVADASKVWLREQTTELEYKCSVVLVRGRGKAKALEAGSSRVLPSIHTHVLLVVRHLCTLYELV
jgi:hypothetical protein